MVNYKLNRNGVYSFLTLLHRAKRVLSMFDFTFTIVFFLSFIASIISLAPKLMTRVLLEKIHTVCMKYC